MKHNTMTYRRCCACDFWVTSADARCPNCGIADPWRDSSDSLTIILSRWWRRQKVDVAARQSSLVRSLRGDEEHIQSHLIEIATSEKQLQYARHEIRNQEPGEAREQALKDLDYHAATLAHQRESYHAKLWAIALVRWQNILEPLNADREGLTDEHIAHRLRLLEVTRERGEMYLRTWEGVDLSGLPEAQQCVERLRHGLAFCDELRDSFRSGRTVYQ